MSNEREAFEAECSAKANMQIPCDPLHEMFEAGRKFERSQQSAPAGRQLVSPKLRKAILKELRKVLWNDSSAYLNVKAMLAAASKAEQPPVQVHQCPRCATSMEVDPTAKPYKAPQPPQMASVPTFPCESCGAFHSYSEVSEAGGYCPQCEADYDERKMLADLLERYAALAAAPQPVAQDGWIPVGERLPVIPEGEDQEFIVCVRRAHNGQSYTFSARYLNAYPLYSEYEEDPVIVSGWHDVKEHAEYSCWYEPLIQKESGDEVTHWMPLPAAPKGGE